jgi:hypothetical protein
LGAAARAAAPSRGTRQTRQQAASGTPIDYLYPLLSVSLAQGDTQNDFNLQNMQRYDTAVCGIGGAGSTGRDKRDPKNRRRVSRTARLTTARPVRPLCHRRR